LNAFDVDAIRARFPALAADAAGIEPLVLDGPGGTQVPRQVPEAISAYLLGSNANLGGQYTASRDTGAIVDAARHAGADFYGARPGEIIFGPNATTLLFNLSRAVAREWKPGDEIIVTALDHWANVSPWRLAAQDAGVTVHEVRIDERDCSLDLDHLASLLNERTRLVAFTAASNTTGTRVDIPAVTRLVREHSEALTCVDAVHHAPHARIDVKAFDCDFLVSSAYKYFGPHLGMLFGRAEVLAALTPYKVAPAKDIDPNRWETGTQSFEALSGFVAAVNYLASLAGDMEGRQDGGDRSAALDRAFEFIGQHEDAIGRRFLERARSLPGMRIAGINDPDRALERTATFGFQLDGVAPGDLAEWLGQRHARVGQGNFYARGLYRQLGLTETDGVVRAGFMHYNRLEDVDRFFGILAGHPALEG